MATVTIQRRKKKDGSSSYPVYFVDTHTGKKRYHASFRTLKDAQLASHTLREALDKGTRPEPRQKARGLTLNEIGNLCNLEWQERASAQEISKSTFEGYKALLKSLLKFELHEKQLDGKILNHPALGNIRIALLTPEFVKKIRAGMAIKQTAVTANRRMFILKELCKHAVKIGETLTSPCEGIGYLSEKKHQRTRFLSPDELDNLLTHAENSPAPYLELAILLGAEHGASLQEILSLKWSDINLHFEDIGMITFFRTKNNKMRTMRLMPRVKEALLKWKERLSLEKVKNNLLLTQKDYVFSHIDGTVLKSFKHAWESVRKHAGLSDFHFHDLRHTFCSSIMLAGGNLKLASEMIGHADIRMTNRYTHLTQLAHNSMQEKLSEFYGQGKNLATTAKAS